MIAYYRYSLQPPLVFRPEKESEESYKHLRVWVSTWPILEVNFNLETTASEAFLLV